MGKVELKLEIDADLLARARARGLEPATVLDAELRRVLEQPRPLNLVESAREKAKDPDDAERRRREWLERNREGIADHNRWIAEHGLLSDHEPFRPTWLK